jgi:HSP20 family protein
MIDIQIINQPLSLASDNDPDPTEKAVKKILNLRHSNHPHTWHPPTDLYETEEHYIVRVEVAGMNKEEFCVNLEEDRLDISGSRPDLQLNRAYHQMEIPYGNFRSTIKLPSAVDGSQVTAEYHDGFLIVTLPKAFPTIIEIKEE